MKRISLLLAATVLVGAAPPKAPPPVANYWMDVATASGMGAGMMGGRPNMAQVMSMMNGGGGGAQHMLNLYLASRDKAPSPQAQHLIPPGMQMGASLPLIAPQAVKPERTDYAMPEHFQRPKGRMIIYWGCGEHAGAGQPTIVDFSKLAAGQMPPGVSAMMSAVRAAQPPRRGKSAGFGEWPNDRDSRPVPAAASLIGAHKVEGNYSPPISFSLGQGQDFMPGLGLREAGVLPSGANRLTWTPAAQATGYALSMFGSSGGGDVVIWSSANKPSAFPNMDYLSPAQVKPLVASGAVLAPTTNQCTIPAEVVKASPTGMVMMIGYGPEAWFQDKPKAPTWTVRARYKTTASVMLGMGDMMGSADDDQPQAQQQEQPKKKKRGFGLGDILQAVPH
ncbi:MAG: hypothetical protein ACTHN4_08235 [Sphingomicrobium sp.]